MRYLFLIALCISTPTSYANSTPWELQRDKDNLKIYQKPSGSGYAITRGLVTIETNMHKLLSFMRDRSTCSRWVYACKSGALIKLEDPNNRLDYTVIDSPLWFSDRDFYVQSQTSFDQPSNTITIKLSGREHHALIPQRVRIKDLYGYWQLKQKENNVFVYYQIHGNPQLLPSPLLDAYMVESVYQTLKNLQTAAKKDYQ